MKTSFDNPSLRELYAVLSDGRWRTREEIIGDIYTSRGLDCMVVDNDTLLCQLSTWTAVNQLEERSDGELRPIEYRITVTGLRKKFEC